MYPPTLSGFLPAGGVVLHNFGIIYVILLYTPCPQAGRALVTASRLRLGLSCKCRIRAFCTTAPAKAAPAVTGIFLFH